MSEFKWGTKKSRQAIIARIDAWAKEAELSVTMLGSESDQADFAPAIVGVTGFPAKPAVVYSINKVIKCLMRAYKFSEEDALDWYGFNTERGLQYIRSESNPPVMITETDDVF